MAEEQPIEKDRVLVIDDDVKLCAMLGEYLTRHGWEVTAAHTGATGLEAARKVRAELVVLDIMLPDFDGFEVLRRLQREMNPHVLLLTARGEEIDRIVGLEMGADDYLPKPFNPRELLARMRAVVRRAHVVPRAEMPAGEVIPGFSVDTLNRCVMFHDRMIDLTDVEFLLLRLFLAPAKCSTGTRFAWRPCNDRIAPMTGALTCMSHVYARSSKLIHCLAGG